MSETNGWPDPARPGVPLNPERDGWHWLACPLKHDVFPRFWRAAGEAQNCRWTAKWLYSRNDWNPKECTYLGPALTPAEVDARVKQARRDALEEAAQWHDQQASEAQRLSDMKVSALDSKVWGDYAQNHREYATAIRALKGEGPASAPAAPGKHVEQLENGARLTTLGQPVEKGQGDD
jgi:hypothetical protein